MEDLWSEEIDEMEPRVSRQIQPAFQGMRDPVWTVIGETLRDHENTGVKVSRLKPGNGEPDEVVAIPGHQNPVLVRSEAELIGIGEPPAIDLVDRKDVEPQAPADLGRFRVDVLIEKKPRG
jgi:hypothetical protein